MGMSNADRQKKQTEERCLSKPKTGIPVEREAKV